jgi:hypothetical protein
VRFYRFSGDAEARNSSRARRRLAGVATSATGDLAGAAGGPRRGWRPPSSLQVEPWFKPQGELGTCAPVPFLSLALSHERAHTSAHTSAHSHGLSIQLTVPLSPCPVPLTVTACLTRAEKSIRMRWQKIKACALLSLFLHACYTATQRQALPCPILTDGSFFILSPATRLCPPAH